MGESSRQKARVAVIQWGYGLPTGFAPGAVQVQSTVFLTPLCTAVSRNLSTRCNKHVIPSQRRSARNRKVKLWSWCQAGQFQLSTCCVSHLPGRARACRVTKVCSWNCPASLASSLCAFLWFYCWQTTACRGGVSEATGAVLADWVRLCFQKANESFAKSAFSLSGL